MRHQLAITLAAAARLAFSAPAATGPVETKYQQIGGPRSDLGAAASGVKRTRDGAGQYQQFRNGAIYWSPRTGAHVITGVFLNKWMSFDAERGRLGYPTTDQVKAEDGAVQAFQHGALYWTNRTGVHDVYGDVYDKYQTLRSEHGILGYPRTDTSRPPDQIGRYNFFEHGDIYWHPQTGAHAVMGEILKKWESSGYEKGPLGYPTSDETTAPGGGKSQRFQRGTIQWDPRNGARIVQ